MKQKRPIEFCNYGNSYIVDQLTTLLKQAEGLREGKDIEYLHKMRVASRRILSSFITFETCLKKSLVKKFSDDLLFLAKSLGKARDKDVQIRFLRDFEIQLSEKDLHPGIKRLILRFKQARENLQTNVLENLSFFENSVSQKKYFKTLQNSSLSNELQSVADQRIHFCEPAKSILIKRIKHINQFEKYIYNPTNVEELHDLRKGMKQLRYTLETLQPVYPEFDEHINNAKSIQDSLGLIHDCDVWMSDLPAYIKKERKKTRDYYGNLSAFRFLMPGFLHLIADRQKIRSAEYNTFIAKWEKLKEMDYWNKVINIECGE